MHKYSECMSCMSPKTMCGQCLKLPSSIVPTAYTGFIPNGFPPNKTTEKPNMIEHPPHYKTGGIETIDYIKAKMTHEQWEGYLLGNVTKYLSRYQHKGKPLEDLRKSMAYLEWLIECYDKFNLEDEKK